jgi:hypothetical protein
VLYCYVNDLYDGQQMRPEKHRPGGRCASATAIATSPELIGHLPGPGCLNHRGHRPTRAMGSNAAALDRTHADHLERVGADQPKHVRDLGPGRPCAQLHGR